MAGRYLTYDELYEDSKAEEEGLVGGGEVDPTVQGHQEHQLHQQGRVHDRVGQTRAQPASFLFS